MPLVSFENMKKARFLFSGGINREEWYKMYLKRYLVVNEQNDNGAGGDDGLETTTPSKRDTIVTELWKHLKRPMYSLQNLSFKNLY